MNFRKKTTRERGGVKGNRGGRKLFGANHIIRREKGRKRRTEQTTDEEILQSPEETLWGTSREGIPHLEKAKARDRGSRRSRKGHPY